MISNNPNTALVAGSGSQYHDLNGLTDLKRDVPSIDPDAAIDEVATQFESMFIQMMLKSMRDALPKDGLFSSNDMDTYTEMADQQIAVNYGGERRHRLGRCHCPSASPAGERVRAEEK